MRQKIQSYEVIEIIGHGGMGIVYKARHEFRKETVAIKSLSHQYVLEPELRKRFRNEAGILDKLDHPNIVKVLDFIEEPDSLNIVMEYVEGRTLDKMIGKEVGPIPYEKALILFEQILRGISYAHQNGVIHRDLKPSNIIVTNDNKIKITDFGIAKVEGSGSHTKTGTKMGTLYYMSPEQIRGERVDERSDIYSLGITLYEMLAGRLPFERKQDTSDFVIMNQIVNEEIKDPREYYPYIPKELVRVIYKAISKEKEKRILSVNNFIDEIKLVKEERKPARIPEVEQKTLIAEKEEPKIIKDVITKDKGKKNNKKNIILAVSLAVLVIIAIVWMSVPKDVASSSDGMTIASGSNDKTVKIGEQIWML
ncbi:MAG: serine/threonine-protein kinase, partial [Ignavibacteriaceae bacterium]